MSKIVGTKRIAKNTVMLYFRQILIMLVSLYTVRVVLSVLGVEDYGIYNVVAGVVTMFNFLSVAMASASQRYFSFDLGKDDLEHLKASFSVTFQIYLLLALIVVFFAETLGIWFLNYKLVIPSNRVTAANWIFQASVVSFLFTLITTPYMASIIAHENMNVYAYVSIAEATLKLVIVYFLKILPYDKLIVYGLLLASVAFINTSLYRFYCHRHYAECHFRFVKDGKLFKEIVSYSSWNLFGSLAGMARNQGITILLNLYFGPIVNAARAVAAQVNGAVQSFAQNFSTALRPQIIKTYAAGKKDEMLCMLMYGTKIVFFLMLIICVPLFFEAPYLINLWLKNVPDHTIQFVRLVLIDLLIDSISFPIMSVVQATGKIKLYQVTVGGLLIMNLPVSYIFLIFGFPPETVFFVAILLSLIAMFLRIVITQHLISFNLLKPFTKLFLLFVFLAVLVSIVPFILIRWFNSSFFQFIMFVLLSVAWSGGVLLFIGLRKTERYALLNKLLWKQR